MALAGGLLGVGAAAAVAGGFDSTVPGVDVWDPVSFLLAPATIVFVAAVAAWVPAKRAAGMHPATVLREE